MAINHDKHIEMGSERGFGLVFAALFAVIGLWPLIRGGDVRLWALAIAALLVLIAFAMPRLLAWPNRLWFKFGLLLGKVVAPVVMAIIFVVTVIPTGFVMRLLGKDLLRTRRRADAATYWEPVDGEKSSMKNQF